MHSPPAIPSCLGIVQDPLLRQEIAVLRSEDVARLDATIEPDGTVSKCSLVSTEGKVAKIDSARARTLLLLFRCKARSAGLYRFNVNSVTLTIIPPKPANPAEAARGVPAPQPVKAKRVAPARLAA